MKYFSLDRFKKEILNADSTPKVTAVSMAIGVAIAFSPFPGLHLIMGFVLARLFRLNAVILVMGILIHNPWTMVPIHLFGLATGDLVLYGSLTSLDQFKAFPWHDLGLATVFDGAFWSLQWPILRSFIKPFFVGSTLTAVITALPAYKLTLRISLRKRELSSKTSSTGEKPTNPSPPAEGG